VVGTENQNPLWNYYGRKCLERGFPGINMPGMGTNYPAGLNRGNRRRYSLEKVKNTSAIRRIKTTGKNGLSHFLLLNMGGIYCPPV